MYNRQILRANVISGAGRGKRIGIPTINLDLSCAPQELKHGIYACFIVLRGKKYQGAMHFGPRPVFKDTETLEIHVLDSAIEDPPATVDIEIVGRIRNIQDFPSTEALQSAIKDDIATVRAMLKGYEEVPEKHHS